MSYKLGFLTEVQPFDPQGFDSFLVVGCWAQGGVYGETVSQTFLL